MVWLFRKGNGRDKDLVVEYTKDLNALSIQIKSFEKKLNGKRSYFWYFHIYVLPLCLSVVYYYCRHYDDTRECLVSWVGFIIGYILIIYLIWKLKIWERQYYTRRISTLRSQYDKKLNEFKSKSQFNEASSMLQRFGGGTDVVESVNEELEGKYDELNKLKLQIDKLKNQEDKNAWFDKVVGVIAGGDDLLVKLICPKCHQHRGLYRYVNEPIRYKCIECGFVISDGEEEEEKKKKS